MQGYSVPMREIEFIRNEVFDFDSHYRRFEQTQQIDAETVSAIFTEAARFFESEIAPLNQPGDEQGCRIESDGVKTPDGYRDGYRRFVENGWPTLDKPEAYGGQGFPESVGSVLSEMSGCASVAWTMYSGLSHGALKTIEAHGSEAQKAQFLPKLVSGEWTGTMCLTESHCGSDLGLLKTRARQCADGSYRLSGSKIFISAGEHDLAENIVHIVLARIEGAPAGTRGISLFIVPRMLASEQGAIAGPNGVSCGSIEKKMGIHGSATCVLNFDDAEGYLLGPENRGLACMFTFMNAARLGTAQQGVVHAEIAYQKSLAYAKERLQMRALGGAVCPGEEADPIIVHHDVRRMLLIQRSIAEGGRAFIAYCTQLLDIVRYSNSEQEVGSMERRLSFLTPIAKAFLTEAGLEAASLGLQCFGGHGYIREWGLEQNLRDARISTLYEGTTGIQAIDLLARKVIPDNAAALEAFLDDLLPQEGIETANTQLGQSVSILRDYAGRWVKLSRELVGRAGADPDEIGAASVDYLMLSGYVVTGVFLLRMAVAASARVTQDDRDHFFRSKQDVCAFYMRRVLTRYEAHALAIAGGADCIDAADFGLSGLAATRGAAA